MIAIRKSAEVEFVMLTAETVREVYEFIHGEIKPDSSASKMWGDYERVVTSGGDMEFVSNGREQVAYFGDVIIKGEHGEFYPCSHDIFSETYDVVDGE